jgi:ketosteroid isomerase-like protein
LAGHQVSNMTNPNLSVVQDFYSALKQGELERARALLHHDVEWIQCHGFPGGAHYRGTEALFGEAFPKIVAEWRDFATATDEFLAAGRSVVVIGRYSGVHARTGRAMEAAFAHVYDVFEGRITRLRQIADTYPMVLASEDRDLTS